MRCIARDLNAKQRREDKMKDAFIVSRVEERKAFISSNTRDHVIGIKHAPLTCFAPKRAPCNMR